MFDTKQNKATYDCDCRLRAATRENARSLRVNIHICSKRQHKKHERFESECGFAELAFKKSALENDLSLFTFACVFVQLLLDVLATADSNQRNILRSFTQEGLQLIACSQGKR